MSKTARSFLSRRCVPAARWFIRAQLERDNMRHSRQACSLFLIFTSVVHGERVAAAAAASTAGDDGEAILRFSGGSKVCVCVCVCVHAHMPCEIAWP